MAKLRIGPLPDDRPVKRTITFTAALDALIRDYAAAIAAQDGLSEAPTIEKLVPIIVERFITTDRAFRAPVRRVPAAVPHKPPPNSEPSQSNRERHGDQSTIAGSE
ncbi:hypothetical protein ACMV_04370 [Acidiphilium multivorum AIU301]|uniref:Uncharacterized protein n=1 Tax=Acidiphilium multivorum (strain DSM 11245 / JCM 8867 / NBRC 100883 / AIU 301) TaxID=926570 RepID=F0J2Z5_ACIMA|nr:DUF2274 domain-containing protein [Acidiphilium multivorum]BAJ79784.1 hypothetical protein ACMV_04370 [Acidiphilium multivorum AIU301]GAN74105.1 hypothetical protein Apmu_0137_19 [Acidiphilium multivorum AIU301]